MSVYAQRQTGSLFILAIWKSGNIYLPIDPAYPRNRIRYMVKDAEVGIILTTANDGCITALEEAELESSSTCWQSMQSGAISCQLFLHLTMLC